MAAQGKGKAVVTDPEVGSENPTLTPAREVGLASMADINDDEPKTVEYLSPSNPAEVPPNFQVVSEMVASEVELCIQEFGIPNSMCCREARATETVSRAEVGWLGVYPGHLQAGLKFPLHPFVVAFLFEIKAIPCQIGTNVWSQLNAFIILCQKMRVTPTLDNFSELFMVKLSRENGYYLYPRFGQKIFITPSSTHPVRS